MAWHWFREDHIMGAWPCVGVIRALHHVGVMRAQRPIVVMGVQHDVSVVRAWQGAWRGIGVVGVHCHVGVMARSASSVSWGSGTTLPSESFVAGVSHCSVIDWSWSSLVVLLAIAPAFGAGRRLEFMQPKAASANLRRVVVVCHCRTCPVLNTTTTAIPTTTSLQHSGPQQQRRRHSDDGSTTLATTARRAQTTTRLTSTASNDMKASSNDDDAIDGGGGAAITRQATAVTQMRWRISTGTRFERVPVKLERIRVLASASTRGSNGYSHCEYECQSKMFGEYS
ncbi:hypothetical protein EDB89DRAFT_1912030 [Lactarius sanguifluus]|nr:hypothetical protein EDB89DRAFT_1912030 [Lactarius sanguifluus]